MVGNGHKNVNFQKKRKRTHVTSNGSVNGRPPSPGNVCGRGPPSQRSRGNGNTHLSQQLPPRTQQAPAPRNGPQTTPPTRLTPIKHQPARHLPGGTRTSAAQPNAPDQNLSPQGNANDKLRWTFGSPRDPASTPDQRSPPQENAQKNANAKPRYPFGSLRGPASNIKPRRHFNVAQ